MMEMKPYYEFVKEKDQAKIALGAKFKNGVTAAIVDLYCINPDCNCVDVLLDFIETDENRNLKGRLFTFRLNTKTWEVSKKNIVNQVLNCEDLIGEFLDDLDEPLKSATRISKEYPPDIPLHDILRNRVAEAKEYGAVNPINWFDELEPRDGHCFGYAEVFGAKEVERFAFDYQGVGYFVDDQYCTNPDCKCDETILTFFDVIPGRETQERRFAVRMSLGTGSYDVEFNNHVPKDEMKELIDRFRERQGKDFGLLKRRYAQMKEFGQKRKERKRQNGGNAPLLKRPKVGRNEPCPCGSGKKYKKCCGN